MAGKCLLPFRARKIDKCMGSVCTVVVTGDPRLGLGPSGGGHGGKQRRDQAGKAGQERRSW